MSTTEIPPGTDTRAQGRILSEDEARAVGRGVPDPQVPLPRVAWPSLILFVLAAAVWGSIAWAIVAGASHWWLLLTVPVHAVVMFMMYLLLHEAIHYSVGRSRWINEWMGRVTVPFIAAWGTYPVIRYLHIEHHRNTNMESPVDPDTWIVSGPRWALPLRWMVMDLHYAPMYLPRLGKRPKKEVAGLVVAATVFVAVCALLVATGHGLALVLAYLLPQRFGVMLIAWWFAWMPHHDMSATAREDRFRTTRIRVGWDGFMNTVGMWQNYHLVHHIHPTIPFYRYIRAWENTLDDWLARDVEIATAWGTTLTPGEYRAWRGIAKQWLPNASRQAFHRLRVDEVRTLAPDAVAVSFALPEGLDEVFAHAPGQHVTLRARIGGEKVRRTYSVCSAAGSGVLRVGIRRVDGGTFSTWATTRLAVGDTLEVAPPAGRFVPPEPETGQGRELVAVAGGAGITPVLSILASTLDAEPESRATLLFANRDAAGIMFSAEVSMLVHKFDGRLRVVHLHSRIAADPPDERPEHALRLEVTRAGRLDAGRLRELVTRPERVEAWFLCGPEAMTDTLVEALDGMGVAPERVHRELFTTPVTVEEPGAGTAATLHVTLDGTTAELATDGDEAILETALRVGLDAPYSCAGGACGTCIASLTGGSVRMAVRHALSDEDIAAGKVLTCQARPTSDVVRIDYDAG